MNNKQERSVDGGKSFTCEKFSRKFFTRNGKNLFSLVENVENYVYFF